jgi:Zn-finger nucleic acid-binding protein
MALFKRKEKIRNCPVDQSPMVKKTRHGVTIDKCEKCGGIWLDQGEIANIILRTEIQQKKYQKEIMRRNSDGKR